MEDSKASGGGGGADKPSAEPNPNPNPPLAAAAAAAVEAGDDGGAAAAAAAEAARRPFTALSQEEADLALARVLQEQERAYMLLRMNGGGGEGSDYGSSEPGSYEYDEEGEEDYEEELEHHLRVHHHEHPVGDGEGEGEGAVGPEGSDYEEEFEEDEEVEPEVDPAEFEDDEAYARALQDAEEREVAARLMALAGLSDWRAVDVDHEEEHANDPQEAWQEVDPDEYSYEELVALGEVVGTESRGLSADTLASLPSVTYKTQDVQDGNTEQCVICRVEFEEGESLIALPCKHSYHPECINQWLQINKLCPMCSAEVSTPGNKEA
ncbi:E3 ubiquitin ligase BIG BROTHER-related-like [Phragmites australis]|uniref:E3 ubiquitin ligase BIG BROTHER-related-like n=1 Tax=Phragmites australis TaxID=29695 RepID=UPI002D783FDA|nr:E3 ubiquitin ligase BIG BROTHER-related-like [Phragmites australis]